MSGLAGLYNVASVPEELHTWSFVHAAHHRDIGRLLYQIFNENLPEFILDPFDPENNGAWLFQHQQMHQQMNAMTGLTGYDLVSVNMKNPAEFANWVFLNADEHYKIAYILGIG